MAELDDALRRMDEPFDRGSAAKPLVAPEYTPQRLWNQAVARSFLARSAQEEARIREELEKWVRAAIDKELDRQWESIWPDDTVQQADSVELARVAVDTVADFFRSTPPRQVTQLAEMYGGFGRHRGKP